ncbi:MAG: O-antigen ligase family protein, partial [Anaerosomatales bacterium]|nr:O-antigen ligase family protein [Anaerosomatales bacterium]
AASCQAAGPSYTTTGDVNLLVTVLFGYFWVLRFGPTDSVQRLAAASLTVTVGLLVAGVLFPSSVWIGGRLLGGVFGGSASPAVLCIVLGLSGTGFRRSSVRRLAILAGGFLLALSQVRAGYVAVAAYLVIAAVIGSRHLASRRVLLALIAATPFVVVTEAWRGLAAYLIRDTASLATLSDRIPLWAAVVGVMMRESPWLGLGFYAIRPWTLAYNEGIGSGHSSYVEVLAGGGILSVVAFVIVLALIAGGLRRAARPGAAADSQSYAQAALGILIACMVLAVTSDEAVTGGAASFGLFMLPGLTSALLANPGGRPNVGS